MQIAAPRGHNLGVHPLYIVKENKVRVRRHCNNECPALQQLIRLVGINGCLVHDFTKLHISTLQKVVMYMYIPGACTATHVLQGCKQTTQNRTEHRVGVGIP